jgi:hypothetical protein
MFGINVRHRRMKNKVVDALCWLALAVGVPGAIYAMSIEPKPDDGWPRPHDTTRCSVCRHYRGNVAPPPIDDPAMILMSPGHPPLVRR